jgi:hypothetical protein
VSFDHGDGTPLGFRERPLRRSDADGFGDAGEGTVFERAERATESESESESEERTRGGASTSVRAVRRFEAAQSSRSFAGRLPWSWKWLSVRTISARVARLGSSTHHDNTRTHMPTIAWARTSGSRHSHA